MPRKRKPRTKKPIYPRPIRKPIADQMLREIDDRVTALEIRAGAQAEEANEIRRTSMPLHFTAQLNDRIIRQGGMIEQLREQVSRAHQTLTIGASTPELQEKMISATLDILAHPGDW